MPFAEAVRIGFASLRANKLRSFLTVLGILIGVSSVIAVVAITEGLDRYISDKVLELGTRSFTVQKHPDVITSREQWIEMMKRKDLTLQDADAIRRVCEACAEVGARVSTARSVKYGRVTQNNVQVTGITENIPRIGSVRDLLAGRHLIQSDIQEARPVAVIGTDLVDAFFGAMEPIGKTISVENHALKVVGVAERKGSVFGESQDNFVWIPITTFSKFYGSRRTIYIQAEARSMGLLEAAQDQARVAMRVRRHLDYQEPDDFNIETGESVMALWQSATRGIYVVTIVVTAISLLVGGIVVMNIMLVSVTERTREIGIRKAVGATRRDVLSQFLVEAVVLSVTGGVAGILLGVGGSRLISQLAGWTTLVSPWSLVMAVSFAAAVGIFFGIYPAQRAAGMDPITALRYE